MVNWIKFLYYIFQDAPPAQHYIWKTARCKCGGVVCIMTKTLGSVRNILGDSEKTVVKICLQYKLLKAMISINDVSNDEMM